MDLSYVISTILSIFSLCEEITGCFDFLAILSATLFCSKPTVASAVCFKCFYGSLLNVFITYLVVVSMSFWLNLLFR